LVSSVSGIAHAQPGTKPALEPYVGSYELAADVTLAVSLEGGSLYAQETGQAKHRLVPVAEHRFSDAEGERELVFALGP
jgi:hypothetical protein